MQQFSHDTLNPLLSERNLSIEDKNGFYTNLNDTQKNLIIGENGAGKTRLLQAIEDFYREKIMNNERNIILIPIYCTKLDISLPSIKNDLQPNDETRGLLWAEIPNKQILEIDKETLGFLLEQILIGPKREMNEIIIRISNELKEFLQKTLTLNTNKEGKPELLITRKGSNGVIPVPLMGEWDLLSPGERLILFLFLLIHYLEQMKDSIDDRNVVILIDEPEQHLHPKVMREIIEKGLLKFFHAKKDGPDVKSGWRLFISSHSVFLIPYFKYEEHIYLKDGAVSKKDSNLYEKLYGDLIGLENCENEGRENLFDFLGSVHTWAYLSYISECFLPPEQVKDINTKDKQFKFLNEKINEKIKEKKIIDVLDYGCGENARIGQILTAYYKENDLEDDLQRKIRYYPYDKYVKNKNVLEKGNYDIILLFNVLHEMDVNDWEKEINKLLGILKDDGFLVFSERKILSIGERPYGKSGFLVLGDKELKKLFESMDVNTTPGETESKLVLAVVRKKEKSDNQIITFRNIDEALNELMKNTKEKIFSVLDKEGDNISSRNYAFYCQQYLNAQYAIDLLRGKNKLPTDFEKWNFARIMSEKDEGIRYFYLQKRADKKYNDDTAKECLAEINNWKKGIN